MQNQILASAICLIVQYPICKNTLNSNTDFTTKEKNLFCCKNKNTTIGETKDLQKKSLKQYCFRDFFGVVAKTTLQWLLEDIRWRRNRIPHIHQD